jgi:hypothetical protein
MLFQIAERSLFLLQFSFVGASQGFETTRAYAYAGTFSGKKIEVGAGAYRRFTATVP